MRSLHSALHMWQGPPLQLSFQHVSRPQDTCCGSPRGCKRAARAEGTAMTAVRFASHDGDQPRAHQLILRPSPSPMPDVAEELEAATAEAVAGGPH